MKKIIYFSLSLLLYGLSLIAQTPQAFKYQAVARTSSGNLITNQLVAFRISILQGSPSGTLHYQERHTTNTNNYGLANLNIGNGSVLFGSFSAIDWSAGSMFIKVEFDPLGGTAYQNMGTTQLLSVPFALHSNSSADLTLPYSGSGLSDFNAFSVTNTGIGNGIYGKGNNGVNGESNHDYGRAVYGFHDFPSGFGYGVFGETSSTGGRGVFGTATSTTGENIGVKGETWSNNGNGIYGYASASTGTSKAVVGLVASPDGFSGYFAGGRFCVDGNVGIGTATPAARLHVTGTDWSSGFIYVEGASGYDAGLRLYEGTDAKWHIFNNSALGGLQIYNSAAQTVFYANQSTGNVGIGSDNSEVALKLATGVQFDPGNYGDNRKGSLLLSLSTGTQGLHQYGPALTFSGINTGRRRAAIAAIQTSTDADQIGLAFFVHPISTSANDQVEQAMIIDHYGRVGIGEDEPWAKLSVEGDNSGPAIAGLNISDLGVYGWSNTSNGVYGKSISGYAGYFEGNVFITGNLSKGSGSFVIDHPLDPENKLLRHNFVESPENLLIYRGKVRLDEKGEAMVELPDYFEALTKEDQATVTLTSIGKPFMTGYEWAGDFKAFRIFGETAREVSWVVYADRDDPVIHELSRPVEEEKGNGNSLCEKGELLYPKAYGYPESAGKDYEMNQKYIRK